MSHPRASVENMTVLSTTIRSVHLVTNAAWFGGSLMGAVGLNPAAQQAGDDQDRAQVADTGWNRWGPVQGAAVGLHLLSGLGIIGDNRRRVVAHTPTRTAVVAKTLLTGAALAGTGAAWRFGEQMGDATERGDREKQRALGERLRWLQWVTPAATGGLLVLDAYLGEQQRGPAGLLDAPTGR